MQIPFADAVLSLFGRRPAALDLIEGVESIGDEIIDTLDAAELPSAEPTLLLQKMKNGLVRHHLETPDVLSSEELRKLRYILSFARLADFEPGAAGPGGTRGRGDVSVGAEIAPWRARVADALYGPLLEERDAATALRAARDVLAGLIDDQDDERRLLAERHGNGFSPRRTGRRGRPQEARRGPGRGRRSGLRLHRRHAASAGGRAGPQETRRGLDLNGQRRRAQHYRVPALHVRTYQLPHLRVDAGHYFLHEQALADFVQIAKRPTPQHARAPCAPGPRSRRGPAGDSPLTALHRGIRRSRFLGAGRCLESAGRR
jgi:hypothetical protein